MRYLTGAVRMVLFLILFLFAIKNHELATLRFYFDLEWKAPLVLLLLIFFAAGVAAGLLACLPRLFRQRREVMALAAQLRQTQAAAGDASPAPSNVVPHEPAASAPHAAGTASVPAGPPLAGV